MIGGLSQADLDWVAAETVAMYGSLMEAVTYTHKASANATPVVSTVAMHLAGYRQRDIDMDMILPNDQKGRIVTTSIAFAPTRHDSFVRTSGDAWKVMYCEGGTGVPFWLVQCRQVA